MDPSSSELQQIVDTLERETLCAVIIDTSGDRASVDLVFEHSMTFRDVDRSVLDTLLERGLLPPRVAESLGGGAGRLHHERQ